MNDNKQVVAEVNTVEIGGVMYNEDQITPSVYFDYVKGLKEKLNNEEYDIIIDTTCKMLNKAKLTGQTDMAKRLTSELELAIREVKVAKEGFDIFIPRKEVEKYIDAVEDKEIKIVELSKYEREIPDEVVDKIEKANELFDELYIVFTDYSRKETKKVAKHRRDKDPILFGAFKNETDKSNIYVEDRLFFIADWKEEKCDLTLEEICRDVQDKTGKDITYKISTPKDEEEVKKLLDSFTKETVADTELEPTTIFEKIKNKVTRKRTSKKTDEENADGSTTKRGRGRKKKEE